MIKILTKVGLQGTYLNITKVILWQNHSQYNTQWWKAESLPTKIWNKISIPPLITSIQHSIGTPSHCNLTRKRNKRYLNWKERGKTVIICRWHNTIYRKCLYNHLHNHIYNHIIKNKIPRYKLKQGGERPMIWEL